MRTCRSTQPTFPVWLSYPSQRLLSHRMSPSHCPSTHSDTITRILPLLDDHAHLNFLPALASSIIHPLQHLPPQSNTTLQTTPRALQDHVPQVSKLPQLAHNQLGLGSQSIHITETRPTPPAHSNAHVRDELLLPRLQLLVEFRETAARVEFEFVLQAER